MIIYFIDLDGTIEDSKKDMTICVNMVRKKLSLPLLEMNSIESHVNRGMPELYKNCFADFIQNDDKKFNLVKQEYELCYFNHVAVHTKCYEGIPESLQHLSQKGAVIVVTNKPEKISRELLRQLKLNTFITDVMGGDSCAQTKPHPLPLEIAAKKLGFHSEKDMAYMIGDSLGDIKVAQAFGAKSVWCAWGYLQELRDIRADYICLSPKDLLTLP